MTPDTDSITRRGALVRLGGLLAAAFGVTGWKLASPHAASAEVVSCLLTPEQTEGPYYIANEKVRRNITEGKPGAPLELALGVLDASTCRPVTAAVMSRSAASS